MMFFSDASSSAPSYRCMIPNGAYESVYPETQFWNRPGIVIELGPKTGYRKMNMLLNVSAGRDVRISGCSIILFNKQAFKDFDFSWEKKQKTKNFSFTLLWLKKHGKGLSPPL